MDRVVTSCNCLHNPLFLENGFIIRMTEIFLSDNLEGEELTRAFTLNEIDFAKSASAHELFGDKVTDREGRRT